MQQIIFLCHWHNIISRLNPTFKDADINDNLSETEWDIFCNNQTGQKPHNM